MAAQSPEILIAHQDSDFSGKLEKSLKSIIPNANIVEAGSSSRAFDELSVAVVDLLIVESGQSDLNSKKLLESLEEIRPQERPRATLIIADPIDREFLTVDLENLNYIRKNFENSELRSLLGSLFQLTESRKKVESGFVFPFIDAAREVFKIVGQTEAEKEKVALTRNRDIKDVCALVPLVSPHFYGSLSIAMEKNCFLSVVSRMLGDSFTELSPDILDAAAEICNQILGFAKAKLNEAGYEIEMALPKVVTGTPPPHSVEGQCFSVLFKTDVGRFAVEAIIK